MQKNPSTKVMEVFSEAADTPAGERDAYLSRVCHGDPELREEVESLLRTQQHLPDFLDTPTIDQCDAIDSGEAAVGLDALSVDGGRTHVGRYTILERIGEGGFGVVYSARQNHPIRRDVALKIVRLGMDSRQIIARFESERQALGLMDHPNIARIFDAGTTADARPYFAMELVRGRPITEYCDDRKLPIPRRLELFVAVCQAVQHAHQKGIIHRDLKPSNILVAEVDGAPVPKVIDFGIAKAISARAADRTPHSELRPFVGTPQYMSPEQAGSGRGDVDTRSDIYSLGVVLYELLSGATPFDPRVLSEASYEQVNHIIREQEIPGLTARLGPAGPALESAAARCGLDGTKLRRCLSGELAWIVTKALEKDRRLRYDTASALGDDLRRHLANEPVLAGRPGTLYRVRKFSRRHRGAMITAAAVAAALTLGLAGTTFGLVRAKHDRNRAEAALAESERLSGFLSDMLRSVDPDQSKGKLASVRDVLDRSARSIDQGAMADHPLVEAHIRMTLWAAYDSLGHFPEAEVQARQAYDLRRVVLGPEHAETLRAMAAVGSATMVRGDFEVAEATLRQVQALQEKTLGPAHIDLVDTLSKLGHTLRARRDWVPAEAVLQRAVDVSRASAPPGSDAVARALTNLGVALIDRGKFDAAEPLLREALERDLKAHGEKFRNVPRNMSNLAEVLSARGDTKGAEAKWLEALRIQREMLPADHQDIAWTLRLLGRVKDEQGDLPAAEAYLTEALAMERRLFRPGHPVLADFLLDLAPVLQKRGKRSEAAAARREEMEIRLERAIAALSARPESGGRRATIARYRVRRSEFDAGLRLLNEAVRLQPQDSRWPVFVALLTRFMGDEAACRDACRRILQQHAEEPEPDRAARAAVACLLGEPAADDLRRITPLAERGAAGQPNPVGHFARGLAHLRLGQLKPAIDRFERAREGEDLALRAASDFYRAIAHHRAGDAAASAAALAAARAGFEKVPTAADGDLGLWCEEWLACQSARREAEALLAPPAATQSASPAITTGSR